MWWWTCCHSFPFELTYSPHCGHIHDLGSVWTVSKCVFNESSSSNVSPQQHWFFPRQVSLAAIKVTLSAYSFFLFVKASSLSFDIFCRGSNTQCRDRTFVHNFGHRLCRQRRRDRNIGHFLHHGCCAGCELCPFQVAFGCPHVR